MRQARAFAKINLALVVGPLRDGGKHEVATVLQRIDLADDVELEPDDVLSVDGFEDDSLVRAALTALADTVGISPRWRVRIHKRIPVAAGLGGGSSDAASALALANAALAEPLPAADLHRLAARIGADVPYFLRDGPQLGTGDGTELVPLALPHNYVVVLVIPDTESKESTQAVYRRFDEREGGRGFDERRSRLLDVLSRVQHSRDLARLPKNDLSSSLVAEQLGGLGAFRADVTGAGPTVYGLFEHAAQAERAVVKLARAGRTWLARPV